MEINHVENAESPRNDASDRKTFKKTSWAMSSAVARSRQKRQARLTPVLPPPNDGFEAAEISGNDARNTLSVLIFVPHRSFFCSQHGTQRATDRLHFLISVCCQ